MGTVMQRELFDAKAAQRGRVCGMDLASQNRRALLATVQSALCTLAMKRESGECSADDGQRLVAEMGYSSRDLGNAAGRMFLKSEWGFVKYVRSERVIGHGNLISLWRLR